MSQTITPEISPHHNLPYETCHWLRVNHCWRMQFSLTSSFGGKRICAGQKDVVPHPQKFHLLQLLYTTCGSPLSKLDFPMVKFGYPHGWTWHGFYDCQNCLFPLYTVLNLDFRRGQKFNVPMRKMGLSRSSNRFFSSSQIRFVYIIKKPPIPLFPMVKMGMKLGYTLWKTFP